VPSLRLRGLKGGTAIVTGGGSGVGAAIALAFAEAGMNLCLVGRRLEPLEAVATLAREHGAAVSCCQGDLADDQGQRAVAAQLVGELTGVDVLVHSAAAHVAATVEAATSADFDLQFQTNVRAPFVLTQALLPTLKSRAGQVVFINSSSGVRAKPNYAQYDATKHALKALADAFREEVNASGIRVLSVYPGRVASPMQARVHADEGLDYHPELLLQPEDVAAVILNALTLPPTAEVTDIHIRPMVKSGALPRQAEPAPSPAQVMEIGLANGRTIRVHEGTDPDALARLVKVLDGPGA
jgi:NADP-dependent 3-hydroxy acid dehydrogenase YdfG